MYTVRTFVFLVLIAGSSPLVAQPRLAAVRIAEGFSRPIYLGAPPQDERRIFIAEQHTGQIHIIDNGRRDPTPFLDISARIATGPGSGRGLLGVAFHPDYTSNGYIYVNYTRAEDGASIVARYTRSADPNTADASSGTIILGPVMQPAANHNGGCLAFGPDGYLYIAFSDGQGGDPGCRAQNGQQLLGKILRLDVDGGIPYAIPPSNPFVGNPAFRDEIWSYGWRVPWRFSFDRATGDMYVGDVGEQTREEISFQPAHSPGGENYGWKVMEGSTCFNTQGCSNPPACQSPVLVPPILDYDHSYGCSVTGGHVYRGCAIPGLQGTYVFGDHCSRRFFSFKFDGQYVTELAERTEELIPDQGVIGQFTTFGEDAQGEIYVVDIDGEIFKIVPARAATHLVLGSVPSAGSTVPLEVRSPSTPGRDFVVGVARDSEDGITLPDGRRIPINYDPVSAYLLTTPNPYLDPYGVLDASGVATVPFTLDPSLSGSELSAAVVVLDQSAPFGILTISCPLAITIL